MIYAQNYPTQKIGIAWQLSEFHGWGVFGINIARAMVNHHISHPVILHSHNINLTNYPELLNLTKDWDKLKNKLDQVSQQAKIDEMTVLHSYGNDFLASQSKVIGSKNIGFIFFEQSLFTPEGLNRAHKLDLVIAGSRWNAEILKKMGLKKVAYVMQGVDVKKYKPVSKKNINEKFIIFSGGKLEFRKGQDIVLAAYKKFYKKYPNSVLVTAWNNPWPNIAQDLAQSPHGFGIPNIQKNQLNIDEWTTRTGLPKSAFHNLGFIANHEMVKIYQQADVGVFPNRAEGGTNLVTMELMACGVPCIISANTGHLDLIGDNTCIPLKNQIINKSSNQYQWGESDIDEIFDGLEKLYLDKKFRLTVGQSGLDFIEQFDWKIQTEKLLDVCSNIY